MSYEQRELSPNEQSAGRAGGLLSQAGNITHTHTHTESAGRLAPYQPSAVADRSRPPLSGDVWCVAATCHFTHSCRFNTSSCRGESGPKPDSRRVLFVFRPLLTCSRYKWHKPVFQVLSGTRWGCFWCIFLQHLNSSLNG